MKKTILSLPLLLLMIVACSPESKTDQAEISAAEPEATSDTDDWIYLFDGSSTEGWRGYNADVMPPGWVVRNDELTYDPELAAGQDYEGGKDIIYGAEEFDNFELYLEWKLPAGGNSGIFYHLKEGFDSPPQVAPEYQLIDDENYAKLHDLTAYNTSLGYTEKPEELKPLQSTGAEKAMHPPENSKKARNPIREWNSTKILFTHKNVEHWLNGKKLLSFVPWDEAWEEKKNSDKWKNSPDYGKFKTGYIGLQDHSSPIWFRNIKIKKL